MNLHGNIIHDLIFQLECMTKYDKHDKLFYMAIKCINLYGNLNRGP